MSKEGQAARRIIILKAAERLVVVRGWRKTTIAQIAREADIAVGSVYLEFSSKARILHELATQRYAHVIRQMRLATMRQGSYAERLEGIMNARTKAFMELAESLQRGCELLSPSAAGSEAAYKRFTREQHDLLGDFLTMAKEEGVFHFDDLHGTIGAILLAYASFAPPALFERSAEDLDASLMSMHALVVHGLSAS